MKLKLDKINFSYGCVPVLAGASFCVRKGEFVSIFCRKGEGASTLAKICCGLILPCEGKVQIDGKTPILNEQKVSLILTKQVFFEHKSSAENLAYVSKISNTQCDIKKIEEVLQLYTIDPKQKPCKMNAKERLLLAFARADYAAKELLVFDNVFAPLSKEERKETLPYLAKLTKNKTVVFLQSQKMKFVGAKNLCLVFGKIYEVPTDPQKAQVAFARMLSGSKEKCLVGNVKQKDGNTFIETPCKLFSLNKSQQNKLHGRMIEKVLVFTDEQDNIAAVYDEMDELFVF